MSRAAYTASCVRTCALRNALVRPDEWQTLAELGSAGAIIAWLKQRGIIVTDSADTLACERAAHASVIRDASALLRFARGPLAALLRCFVYYYDLLNIETVIQRIHALPPEADRPASRFYDTAPFGRLQPATLDAATNYPALANALRHTPFAAAFDAALLRYHDDEDVTRLIERIERAFFADWVGAAKTCGLHPCAVADTAPLGVYLRARAIEAAVRLKLHRKAATNRLVEWLALVAPPAQLRACLEALAHESEADAVQVLIRILLPAASRGTPAREFGPRGHWGLLDDIVMRRALRSMRGIAFDADFLTGFLVCRICQARELTVLLESREADIAVPTFIMGGAKP